MDEKRLILAAVLSLAVIAIWHTAFAPATPPRPTEPPVEEAREAPVPPTVRPEVAPLAAAVPNASAAVEPLAATSEERIVVDGEGFVARLSNRGAVLTSFELEEHHNALGQPLDMVRERASGPYPYALVDPLGAELLAGALFAVERPTPQEVRLRYAGVEGVASKTFRFGGEGLLEVEIEAALAGGAPWRVFLGPGVRNPTTSEDGQQYQVKEALWRSEGSIERLAVGKVEGLEAIPRTGLEWLALDDTYFISAVFVDSTLGSAEVLPLVRREDAGGARFDPVPDTEKLTGKERKASRELGLLIGPSNGRLLLDGFWGGKERRRLATLGLDGAIDWGFFGILSRPLHVALLWIHDRVVPNFGWAIVLLTIALKVVLFPLTHASHVSMQKMQVLNPKVQAIRARYRGKLRDKDNRFNLDAQRKMNEEIQALYSTAGVNPLGGCLPMLAQIPVFFAFFRLLPLAIELRQAPWLGWIEDLSAADPWYLLPIIMGATQLIQMRLTPQATDPIQKRIMQLFPVVFTVFSLGFPSGLVLYWLTNNVFTIGQIATYNRWRARHGGAGQEGATA